MQQASTNEVLVDELVEMKHGLLISFYTCPTTANHAYHLQSMPTPCNPCLPPFNPCLPPSIHAYPLLPVVLGHFSNALIEQPKNSTFPMPEQKKLYSKLHLHSKHNLQNLVCTASYIFTANTIYKTLCIQQATSQQTQSTKPCVPCRCLERQKPSEEARGRMRGR
jgi:hypothetical protein